MSKLNILIVEGNLKEENLNFQKEGIPTHTESLKDSLSYFKKDFKFDVINPSSDEDLQSVKSKLPNYNGLIEKKIAKASMKFAKGPPKTIHAL